jgi:signal transduction histidine kinase
MSKHALAILIADDDEGDRTQIKRALARSGLAHHCTESVSIEEALEICRRMDFDCAIVDYCLPGQDGLGGITMLRELHPDMAIIMSTGQGDEMIAAEAIKRGATDYIPKMNISPDSVRRMCENAVERMHLQQKVARQRAELENFTNLLVHDLKSPLTTIQSFAHFIEHSISEGKPEGVTGYCQRLIRAAARMNTLIDTLYQYTRADARVLFGPVAIEAVLHDALSNLQGTIEERGARVTHDVLPVITGNTAQLTLLLQNLIANGIKYCQAPTPEVHVAAQQQQDGAWLLSVHDNGIGIPEAAHKTVFEPFMRLHGVGEYEGTGLGLATCKKIVERHGGRIWCKSEPGDGSTFFFTLPAGND